MHWSQIFWPSGRTNRAPYWVLNFLLNGLLTVLDKAISNPSDAQALGVGILLLTVAYIGICLLIGLLHDIDRSGWWSVPIVIAMSIIMFVGTSPELKDPLLREYGILPIVVIRLLSIVGIGGGIYLAFRSGTQGPNRFGPDPLVKPMPA
jgi:uncharacterized membrane protein YhaH (DUF805 family)